MVNPYSDMFNVGYSRQLGANMAINADGVYTKSKAFNASVNINTPLQLAIRNQTDRFSLAIDAIDRMPRFGATGASVREALVNQQIACEKYAYEFGVDSPEINDWKWPF